MLSNLKLKEYPGLLSEKNKTVLVSKMCGMIYARSLSSPSQERAPIFWLGGAGAPKINSSFIVHVTQIFFTQLKQLKTEKQGRTGQREQGYNFKEEREQKPKV